MGICLNNDYRCYSPDGSLREWALLLRIILLLFTLFIALSVPYLIEVMGMVGNITGQLFANLANSLPTK